VDELGTTLRPRGVQKRVFRKDKRFQLIGRGGVFAADLLSTSYLAGGGLLFYFTEDFALEASFEITHIALDLDEPIAAFFGNDNFEPGMGYLALGNLVWSPIHAKLKIGGAIFHSSFSAMAGAGRLFHDSVQGVTFDAGLAWEIYFTSWFTLRFDVRDIIVVQEAVAQTRITNNIAATMGLGLWIPFGL